MTSAAAAEEMIVFSDRDYARNKVFREGYITLALRGENFPAHSDILYAASNMVRGLLQDTVREHGTTMALPDTLDPDALDQFLCVAYGIHDAFDVRNAETSYAIIRVLEFFDAVGMYSEIDDIVANKIRWWETWYTDNANHGALPEALTFFYFRKATFKKSYSETMLAALRVMARGGISQRHFLDLHGLDTVPSRVLVLLQHAYSMILREVFDDLRWNPKRLTKLTFAARMQHMLKHPRFVIDQVATEDRNLQFSKVTAESSTVPTPWSILHEQYTVTLVPLRRDWKLKIRPGTSLYAVPSFVFNGVFKVSLEFKTSEESVFKQIYLDHENDLAFDFEVDVPHENVAGIAATIAYEYRLPSGGEFV